MYSSRRYERLINNIVRTCFQNVRRKKNNESDFGRMGKIDESRKAAEMAQKELAEWHR